MAVHTMTPARKAALRKAQLASAAKRRGRRRAAIIGGSAAAGLAFHHATGAGIGRMPILTAGAAAAIAGYATKDRSVRAHNARINKRINTVENRRVKRVTPHANVAERNTFTHSVHGGLYLNQRGMRAFQKGQRVNARAARKKAKLKARMR